MRSGSTCINDSDGRKTVGTTYRLLEVGDELVPVLVLLETGERHLRAGDVLDAEKRMRPRAALMTWRYPHTFFGFSRYSKSVPSSQVMPLLTLAAVYEKPSLWPVLRPNILEVVDA